MKLFCRAAALVLCMVLIAFALCGCGGKKPQTEAPKKKSATAASTKTSKPTASKPEPKPEEPASTAAAPDQLIPGIPGLGSSTPGAQPPIPGLQPAAPAARLPKPGAIPAPRPLPPGRPSPKDLLRAVRATYATLQSVRLKGVSSLKVEYDGKPAGSNGNDKFELTFKRPDKFDYTVPHNRMVSNGKTVYTYYPEPKRYIKGAASGQELRGMMNARAGIGIWGLLLGADYEASISSMKLLKDSKIRGKDVFVLSLKLKPGVGCPTEAEAAQKLHVSKSDLMVWRNELVMTQHPKVPKDYKGKAPKTVRSVNVGEMTSVEVNPKIADSAFRFNPPAGAKPFEKPKLVDVTDKPAPDFSFKLADGTEKKMSDLRGRVVVLAIWALPPAEKSMPALQKAYERCKDEVEFVAINVNEKEDKIDDYMKEKSFTFPNVHVTPEIIEVGTKGYGVRAIPTVFIIDAEGIVRRVITGDITEADLSAKIEKIKGA